MAKPLVEEHPDKANYVSEFDTKVDKETKLYGRDHGGAKDGATPTPPTRRRATRPTRGRSRRSTGKGGTAGAAGDARSAEAAAARRAATSCAVDRDGEKPRAGRTARREKLSPRQQREVGENGDGVRARPAPKGRPARRGRSIPR